MGLLDWFKKKAPTVRLEQLSYDVAYFVLPDYVFNNLLILTKMCEETPAVAGPFFYVMAAKSREVEPVIDDGKRFKCYVGNLGDARYFAFEFPVPAPVDMTNASLEDVAKKKFILAPHFCVVVLTPGSAHYFILGQAPIPGKTTLRCILAEGSNCNLGPGPQPNLPDFLEAVKAQLAKS